MVEAQDQQHSSLPVKWADGAMYQSAPMQAGVDPETGGMAPRVHMLSMTPDPLGAIAAACMIYEGKVVYSLLDITDEQRLHYWAQVQKTHLTAPLEFVDMHFLLEGVTRAFTHQLVRQRTAVYAQESLRFAVKDNLADEIPLPPSLVGRDEDDPALMAWLDTMLSIEDAYAIMVANGVPQEDARGLLPHQTTTRVHFKTNLRALLDHAGNRLCTQAQFEWRLVFMEILRAIDGRKSGTDGCHTLTDGGCAGSGCLHDPDAWQYPTISKIFRPVCYQLGHCPFNADFDRGCTIRERVDTFAKAGVPSSQWHDDSWMTADQNHLATINPAEWLLDPRAAWVR